MAKELLEELLPGFHRILLPLQRCLLRPEKRELSARRHYTCTPPPGRVRANLFSCGARAEGEERVGETLPQVVLVHVGYHLPALADLRNN